MYRLGCCIPGASFMPEGVGKISRSAFEVLKSGTAVIRQNGYDFAEATVGLIMGLSEEALAQCSNLFSIEICNSFIPPDYPIITGSGPSAALKDYVRRALQRMDQLNIRTVVFGSGTARRIPEGISQKDGMKEFRDFLLLCEAYGKQYDVCIAIEPLNRRETNAVTTVAQAAEIAAELNLPHISVLADAFHMYCEQEPLSVLRDAMPYLTHVHVSDPDRSRPGQDGGAYLRTFAEELINAGYCRRITSESVYKDFPAESRAGLEFMKKIFA